MTTSIYLGPDDADGTNALMLLGGAYDKAKIDGELFTVGMVDPHDLYLANGQTNVVNVTAVEVVLDGGNRTAETYGEKDIGVPVLLDTGVARWYLSDTTANAVFHGLGGSGAMQPGSNFQVVDCIYRDPAQSSSYVSVEFGVAGSVKIALHSLVTKFVDGTCGSFIAGRGPSLSVFGDPFLRGVYTIFDQENLSVSMGQVKHTDVEDIVRIPEGGFNLSA
jgi:hypothetical protein